MRDTKQAAVVESDVNERCDDALLSTLRLVAANQAALPNGALSREYVDGLLMMIAASLRAGLTETSDE